MVQHREGGIEVRLASEERNLIEKEKITELWGQILMFHFCVYNDVKNSLYTLILVFTKHFQCFMGTEVEKQDISL